MTLPTDIPSSISVCHSWHYWQSRSKHMSSPIIIPSIHVCVLLYITTLSSCFTRGAVVQADDLALIIPTENSERISTPRLLAEILKKEYAKHGIDTTVISQDLIDQYFTRHRVSLEEATERLKYVAFADQFGFALVGSVSNIFDHGAETPSLVSIWALNRMSLTEREILVRPTTRPIYLPFLGPLRCNAERVERKVTPASCSSLVRNEARDVRRALGLTLETNRVQQLSIASKSSQANLLVGDEIVRVNGHDTDCNNFASIFCRSILRVPKSTHSLIVANRSRRSPV